MLIRLAEVVKTTNAEETDELVHNSGWWQILTGSLRCALNLNQS